MKAKCCESKDLADTAQILRSVSEENRLKIVCMLKDGEKCVCKLQEGIGAPHNLVLHHLKSLKKLGLVNLRRDHRFTYYSLNQKVWSRFTKEIEFLFNLRCSK